MMNSNKRRGLTLATGEGGYIVDVDAPAKAKKGEEVTVQTKVKNDGTEKSEFYILLRNPEGKIIDKEPDVLLKNVEPGEEATIETSTHWDPQWAMPGYDWDLSVELWEIDKNFWGIVTDKTKMDTKAFTVELDTEYAEGGEIISVDHPASVRAGEDFVVKTTVKNTGTKTSELRVYLQDSGGSTIDWAPATWKSVEPGETVVITNNTGFGESMPDHDYDLQVVLYDIDLFSWKDRLDDESFTIALDTSSAEGGKIVDVDYQSPVRKGDEVTVRTKVYNDGDEPSEFYIKLKNPEGKIIDKEPDLTSIPPALYKTVAPGGEAVIETSTHWDPLWAMPNKDWHLSVELWEWDIGGDDKLDTEEFTVELDTTPEEGGKIKNVYGHPDSAREGDLFEITAIVENPGSKTSELQVHLLGPDLNVIDKSPFTYVSVPSGGTVEIVVDNKNRPMPGSDWDLMVVLYDIDLLSWKDRLDDRSFTILHEPNGNGGGCSPEGAYSDDGTQICINGVWEDINGGCSPEGAYSPDGTQICINGVWQDIGGDDCSPEGAYSPDGTQICINGVWQDISGTDGKWLTPEQALERLRSGLSCYIKCVLPLLDMLPGISYSEGMWIPPFCAISKEP